MRRARGLWTATQLRRLAEGYAVGASVDHIAAALAVTRARVLHKARALGLTHRSRRRRNRFAEPALGSVSAAMCGPAARPPIDDRNPLGPVARSLRELAGRVRETRDGFVLDRCPASVFRIIRAANVQRAALGMGPIRVRATRRPVPVPAEAAE